MMESNDLIVSYIGLQECILSSLSPEGQCQTWSISSLRYFNNFIWKYMFSAGFALSVLFVSTIIILLVRKVWSLTVQMTYKERIVWLVLILAYFFRVSIIVKSYCWDQTIVSGDSNEMLLQQSLFDKEAVLRFFTSSSEKDHWYAHQCLHFERDNCFCNEVKKLLFRIATSNEEKFIWHNHNNGSDSCINNSIYNRVYMPELLYSYETGLSLIVFIDTCLAIYAYWIINNKNSSLNSEDKYDETLISV